MPPTASAASKSDKAFFISALGTPLTESEALHEEGLEAHLDDQWKHGISGVLASGTMGGHQMLTDEVWKNLARRTVELSKGKGEVMIGASDCSFARARDRIEFLNTIKPDAVVVLTPYFFSFNQAEITQYFKALADISKAPIFLYDLPQRTHIKIQMATAIELSKHPNIAGIKCSDEPGFTRELRDATDKNFRIVFAQPVLADVLLRSGYMEHLDGMYAVAPQWTVEIGRRVAAGDAAGATEYSNKLAKLRTVIVKYNPLPCMTAMLNARGIPGNYSARPYRALSAEDCAAVAKEPIMVELINAK